MSHSPPQPRRIAIWLAATLTIALAAGCVEHAANIDDQLCISDAVCGEDTRYAGGVCSALTPFCTTSRLAPVDVLIVVSNTPSMCDVQTELLDSVEPIVGGLAAVPSARVAVINTDMVDLDGGVGQLRTAPGSFDAEACSAGRPDLSYCPSSVGPVLSVARFRRADREVELESFRDELSCLLAVGTEGTPAEMGLETMRQALSRPTADDEFLRPDAHLAVILVSNGDDCSDGTRGLSVGPVYEQVAGGAGVEACDTHRAELTPVAEYREFLLTLLRWKNGHGDDLADAAKDLTILALVNSDEGLIHITSGSEPLVCGAQARPSSRYLELAGLSDASEIIRACDGENAVTDFGPVLEDVFGHVVPRVGRTTCLRQMPQTCTRDADCPEGQRCAPRVYFEEAPELAYRLCDGFEVRIEAELPGFDGTLDRRALEAGVDFELKHEVGSCLNPDGTGTPIEVVFLGDLPYDAALSIAYPRATDVELGDLPAEVGTCR